MTTAIRITAGISSGRSETRVFFGRVSEDCLDFPPQMIQQRSGALFRGNRDKPLIELGPALFNFDRRGNAVIAPEESNE